MALREHRCSEAGALFVTLTVFSPMTRLVDRLATDSKEEVINGRAIQDRGFGRILAGTRAWIAMVWDFHRLAIRIGVSMFLQA